MLLTVLPGIACKHFMLVYVRENSMAPTLVDGQLALVLRGGEKMKPGDIALFISPHNGQLAVKRCILRGDETPQIKHGWLSTAWGGKWFLDEREWNSLINSHNQLPDAYFMAGDNQFHSLDSRQYGYIPKNQLLGRVILWRRRG